MKVEVKIDPARAEPTVTVTAPALTEEVRALVRSLEPRVLTGWRGEEAIPLEPGDLLRCYAANKGVYAQSPAGEYLVKLRLYELEERLDPRGLRPHLPLGDRQFEAGDRLGPVPGGNH